jgi:hypothetical protein
MIQVLIEVDSGFARFGVWAQAVSIRRALELVTARFPDADLRVSFPIDPDGFFIMDPAARAGLIGREQVEQVEA